MSFRKAVHENIYLLVWENPTKNDAQRLVLDVMRLSHKYNKKVIYVAVAPDDSKPPNDDAKKQLAIAIQKITAHCKEINLVFEGQGLHHATKRSALTKIIQKSDSKETSGGMNIYRSFNDFLKTLDSDVVDIPVLRGIAQNLGLVV